MALLVTVDELATDSQKQIPPQLVRSAEGACTKATSLVCGHLGMTATAALALDGWKVEAIKAVAMGVATDIFENPTNRASYSAEGLNYSAAPRPRRSLFPAEKATLDGLFVDGFA